MPDIVKQQTLHEKNVWEKSRECHNHKKVKRKVQGVPQSQTAALPRPPENEETDKSKQPQGTRTKSTKISSLFPKRGNRNTKRTEKHKNKMTHGKTYNKSPRRINHKATKSKTIYRLTCACRHLAGGVYTNELPRSNQNISMNGKSSCKSTMIFRLLWHLYCVAWKK